VHAKAVSRYSLAVHGGSVRWHTRVFAVELLDRIIVSLAADPLHTDLTRASRAAKGGPGGGGGVKVGRRASSGAGLDEEDDFGGFGVDDGDDDDVGFGGFGGFGVASPVAAPATPSAPVQTDFLVLRLNDLIRMTFNASTAVVEPLRLAGFRALQSLLMVRACAKAQGTSEIVRSSPDKKTSSVPLVVRFIQTFGPMDDPYFEGHSLLEQYQAQIGAALRPAFAVDATAAVMASACRLCALYLTCGVGVESSDQARTVKLLQTVFERVTSDQAARAAGAPSAAATVLATSGCFSQQELVVLELQALAAWADVAAAQAQPQGAKLGLAALLSPYVARCAFSGQALQSCNPNSYTRPSLSLRPVLLLDIWTTSASGGRRRWWS